MSGLLWGVMDISFECYLLKAVREMFDVWVCPLKTFLKLFLTDAQILSCQSFAFFWERLMCCFCTRPMFYKQTVFEAFLGVRFSGDENVLDVASDWCFGFWFLKLYWFSYAIQTFLGYNWSLSICILLKKLYWSYFIHINVNTWINIYNQLSFGRHTALLAWCSRT